MTLSYIFHGDIYPQEVSRLADFINTASYTPDTKINIYLSTPGGDVYGYNAFKHILEESELDITLIANEEICSYGIILFYTCERVTKMLMPYTHAMVHSISAQLEDRDLHDTETLHALIKSEVDDMNEELKDIFKTNRLLNTKQLDKFSKGGDIVLSYKELYKAMKNCPYGIFIK